MLEFGYVLWYNLASFYRCFNLLIFSNYGMGKDPYNGKVRSMWQSHNLWSQPQLLLARNQPDLSPELAESNPA